MQWQCVESTEENDGVREWKLYIMLLGQAPDPKKHKPFARGWWFYAKDETGDKHGERLFNEAKVAAELEVERLNRLGRPPPERR